jgi:hypothetical protein
VLAPEGVSEKAMRDFPMLTRKDPSKHDHDEVALLSPQSLTDRNAIRDTAPKNYDELFVQSQFVRL